MSDLPPLPPDDILDEDECSGCVYGYTERQMTDYARAAIALRDEEITRLREYAEQMRQDVLTRIEMLDNAASEIARLRSLLAEAQRQIAFTPLELLDRIDTALKEKK